MRHYVYETTNLTNGKIYVGIHSMDGEFGSDGYMGSGTAIVKAIKKYGKENFTSIVVDETPDRETALELEELIVDIDFTYRSDTYNIAVGGSGNTMLGRYHTEETKRKIGIAHKGREISEESRRKMSESSKGKTHTEATRKKLREAIAARPNPMHNPEVVEKLTGVNNHRFKGWYIIDSVRYPTSIAAGKALGVSDNTIRNRTKNPNFPNYSFEPK